jgi:hypothetical protein
MSHMATTWTIKQRGLKPATKIVLWHLRDRHHPDNGCFPSQEPLAGDCEISRSALNDHLKVLEVVGLIFREVSRSLPTRRQERMRYRFTFEENFSPARTGRAAEPKKASEASPDSGHGAESGKDAEPSPDFHESSVRNPDSNLVREPVSERERENARARVCEDADFEADWQDARKTWPDMALDNYGIARTALRGLPRGRRKVCIARIPDYVAFWRRKHGQRKLPPFHFYAGEDGLAGEAEIVVVRNAPITATVRRLDRGGWSDSERLNRQLAELGVLSRDDGGIERIGGEVWTPPFEAEVEGGEGNRPESGQRA